MHTITTLPDPIATPREGQHRPKEGSLLHTALTRLALFTTLLASVGCTTSTTSKKEETPTEEKKPEEPRTRRGHLIATSFKSPVEGRKWVPDTYLFGKAYSYPTERPSVMREWGIHLGEDMTLPPGTKIVAIAHGKVSYATEHPGKSKDARNWGGVVIMGHWLNDDVAVYSLYGHLVLDRMVKQGSFVRQGHPLGTVADKFTPQGGWWEIPHLHAQINLDPADKYRGGVMPGYAQGKAPFRLRDHISLKQVLDDPNPVKLLIDEERRRRK